MILVHSRSRLMLILRTFTIWTWAWTPVMRAIIAVGPIVMSFVLRTVDQTCLSKIVTIFQIFFPWFKIHIILLQAWQSHQYHLIIDHNLHRSWFWSFSHLSKLPIIHHHFYEHFPRHYDQFKFAHSHCTCQRRSRQSSPWKRSRVHTEAPVQPPLHRQCPGFWNS